ncbi:dihydroorotase [Sulfobacillus harzensis]|uniref:Dihydroorotase n=1 Tax=Sulfobacillus harzensis TaxID=2729629 RepID=A0A7Y0L231_9FIRM|nr:dihydroorotase [Sulfobacillus harzensis]NMP21643.1 dihydroorotase [Sulfobacillus harzensis]
MTTEAIRIRGGRIIDPYRGLDHAGEDILIVDGRFATGTEAGKRPVRIIDAQGLWVVPRIVDMHVHLREPGQTHKETIESGSRAAARGGVAVVGAMPNTTPVMDTPELVQWVQWKGDAIGLTRVWPIGAVSRDSASEELADLYRMQEAGAVAFSDDGRPVGSSRLMRAALSYSATLRTPIINHAQDPSLSAGAVVNEGPIGGKMGLAGMPEAAESVMVWRDVLLAGLTGGRLHVAHVTAPESLEALSYARSHHFLVSAEATPHHLLLSEDALQEWGYDPVTKVNPPLRTVSSRRALILAMTQGLVEVVASDHAPHHADEKARPYGDAPFGISGLETLVAGVITALVQPGHMTPLQAMALLTRGPHQALNQPYAGISPGEVADVTLIDPQKSWVVDPARFYSQGKNTPFAGHTLVGDAVYTIVGGQIVMEEGEVLHAGLSNLR